MLVLLCGLAAAPAVQAQMARSNDVWVQEASLHARESAVLLNAHLELKLPEAVEQALRKGIPIIFVAHARVVRARWYWTNAILADTTRYYRLSFQPLTNRWRLSISAERPQPGGGLTFGQNFESLDEALNVMRRIMEWRVAPRAEFSAGQVYRVEFAFHLDVTQLPRLLQIGMSWQDDWRMATQVDFNWTPESAAAALAQPQPVPHAAEPVAMPAADHEARAEEGGR